MSGARVVLVTGGAKGVGRAIVERFARREDRVILNFFHSAEQARTLQDRLRAEGYDVTAYRASVARDQQRSAMFEWIAQEYGQLDVLVNNAAMGFFRSSSETSQEHLRRSFEVNVDGVLACAQEARELLAQNCGRIVNLSSVGSNLVVGNYASVGTSKAAVEALTRYLATEWARYGIRVNCVSGGLVEGDVADAFPDAAAMQDAVRSATPFGRLGTATELAGVVEFLCSPEAGWITGQTLVADGGLSLGGALLSAPDSWAQGVAQARASETGAQEAGRLLADDAPVASPREAAPPADLIPTPSPGYDDAIAIVGMGLVVPGASDPGAFWEVLRDGPELLASENPARIRSEFFFSPDGEAIDKTYQIASGYVDDYTPNAETASELGANPRASDYPTQWFRHALRDALLGVRPAERVGCAIGYTADGNQHLEEALVVESMLEDIAQAAVTTGIAEAETLASAARSLLLERYPLYAASGVAPLPSDVGNDAVRGIFGVQPEVSMIDTACSSSLYALDIAVKALLERQHDMAVCGGTFSVGPRNAVLFAKLHGLSPSGDLRPLDEACDGVLFSDGAAAIVLKRHADAVRDGDRILGFVGPMGASSDGKGKAIYAPNVRGQKLAIARASAKSGAAPLDWIVAHATGTPAGDLCEISSIRETHAGEAETLITSNKSLIGHTGWAAGVVSLIQVLLSLKEETILPQLRFERAPEAYGLAGTRLRIPRESVAWPPRDGSPRRAAISGFGFGGTNAHLIVQDVPFRFPSVEADEIVISGWAADLPGSPNRADVESWARGERKMPATFGALYDTTTLGVRMPPRVLRTLDRCQLMAVRCAQELQQQLGTTFWNEVRERIGVFVGHMGPTHNAVMYARRCHVDSVFDALQADERFDPSLTDIIKASISAGVVASNEDSFPGIMPNIISARISNQLDTNGPNMGIDTGAASTLTALETAARYLRAGEIDVAVVGGVHGNSTDVLRRIVEASLGSAVEMHEGAVLFSVMRRSTALERGLPVLGVVNRLQLAETPATVDPDAAAVDFYGGAQSARAVLAALMRSGRSIVSANTGLQNPAAELAIDSVEPTPEPQTAADLIATTASSPVAAERSVQRWDRVWLPATSLSLPPGVSEISPGSLVITATPDMLLGSDLVPRDASVITTVPSRNKHHRRPASTSSEELARTVGEAEISNVRVLLDLASLPELTDPARLEPFLLAHDLMFLGAQALERSGGLARSFGICLLGSWPGGELHPLAGLFLGFVKSLALELPGIAVRGVAVDHSELSGGLGALEAEFNSTGGLPTAGYRDGIRYREGVRKTGRADGAPFLEARSVVVVTAGGKGITAEIVRALAKRYGCSFHLLGSTDLETAQREIEKLGGAQTLVDRGAFIRRERSGGAGLRVADINRRFDRLTGALEILDTISAVEEHSGSGQVQYHCADVTDPSAVAAAVKRIEATSERIDLVIHGAGVNRAASVTTKTLEQFRMVRNVKVGGYLALKRAFHRPPLHWCSFSSLIGLTGQRGETDYAASNDFLVSAAGAERARGGTDEFAIGWTLWKEAGMAASSVHQSFFTGAMSDVLTLMPTKEGVDLFLEEIEARERTAGVVHIGAVERASIDQVAPGFFVQSEQPNRRDFYIDTIERYGPNSLTARRQFTDRDAFLEGHSVNGVGTLPGCFVAELIAEAAVGLRADLVPIGIRDLEFQSFLRLDGPATRAPLVSRATVRTQGDHEAVVDVVVTADVLLPNGRVVTRNKPFYTGTVLLGRRGRVEPEHIDWPVSDEETITDPYHADGSPVRLRDEFVSTTATRLHPLGKRARYRASASATSPYAQMHLPVLLMDGLVRLAVLERTRDGALPVAAPTRIGRIDYFDALNDAELTEAGDAIELFATPLGLGINIDSEAKFWAVRNGRVLMQMTQVEGVVMGYIDEETGLRTSTADRSVSPSLGVIAL